METSWDGVLLHYSWDGDIVRELLKYAEKGKLHPAEKVLKRAYMRESSRDRDRIYVTSLVYPDTRLVEFVPGYPLEEDATNLVLRAAFDYGIAEAEELLGMKDPVQESNGAQHGRALAGRILRAGNFAAQIGLIHQDLPALTNARGLLRKVGGRQWKEGNSAALDDDDVRGLGGMSRGRSIQEIFLDIIKPELEHQRALQNSAPSGNGRDSSETR